MGELRHDLMQPILTNLPVANNLQVRQQPKWYSLPEAREYAGPLEENAAYWHPNDQPVLVQEAGNANYKQWSTQLWENCHGLISPTDEETGLPIPILITEPPSPNAETTFVDYHHLFHPEVSLMHGDDGDIAVRRSYGQDLPRWLHEHNHAYFSGPRLPQSRQDKFVAVTLACAGVVPRKAIEFTRRGPFTRHQLSDSEYARVTDSVRYEGQGRDGSAGFYRSQIGMFFANYAVEQSVEQVVSERVIDEFLETTNNDRRVQLGNLLLRECIKMSVEPIRPLHRNLRSKGLMPRKQTDLDSRILDFFVRSRRKDYHIALMTKWRPELARA